MTGPLRILFVSCRSPWPTIGGREGTIARYLQMLGEQDEVHLAAFNADGAQGRDDRLASFTPLPRSTLFDMVCSVLRRPLLPLQCHFLGGRKARAMLRDIAARTDADVIIYDMVRLYDLGERMQRGSRARAVIDLDDLISIRYERLQGREAGTSLLGTFANFLPGFAIRAAGALPGLLLRAEAWLVRRAEIRTRRSFAGAILVSQREGDLLAKRQGGAMPILVAPPALTVPRRVVPAPDDAIEFAFIGNANTVPNAEALSLFDEIAGEVRRCLPEANLRFRSYGPPNAALTLAHVEVLGFVDDLDAIFHENLVVVAPVLSGSGVKIKVLDAMMRGVPVVTGALGIEGIEASGAAMRLCDGRGEYVERLSAIAAGDVPLAELRAEAQPLCDAVRAGHDYDRVAERLRQFLRAIVVR